MTRVKHKDEFHECRKFPGSSDFIFEDSQVNLKWEKHKVHGGEFASELNLLLFSSLRSR